MTNKNLLNKQYGSVEMDAVEDLIETYGTQNPFILCKKLNYKIKYANLGNRHGLILNENTIVINNNFSIRKQHIICAYLMGILFLHLDFIKEKVHTVKNIFTQPDQYSLSGGKFAIHLTLAEKNTKFKHMLTKNTFSIFYGLHLSYYCGQAF